jgi:hypothetical protein
VHLDLHGHGFAGQVFGQKIFGEGDGAFAFAAIGNGFDQGFKVFQGLAFAKGQIKAFGLHAFHGLAVFKSGKVHGGNLPVHSGVFAFNGNKLRAVAKDAVDNFLHFLFVHNHFFLFHFQAFIGRQGKGGQHFKFNAVLIALASIKGVLGVHVYARKGGNAELLHNVVDVDVDEILAGFFINFVAEALFDDRRRNFALAKTVQLHRGFVQCHGAHDGCFHFLSFRSDDDLFSDRRDVFCAIFHEGLLFLVR